MRPPDARGPHRQFDQRSVGIADIAARSGPHAVLQHPDGRGFPTGRGQDRRSVECGFAGRRRRFGRATGLGRGIHLFSGLRRVFRASADRGQWPRPLPPDQVRKPTLSLPSLLDSGIAGRASLRARIQPFQGFASDFPGVRPPRPIAQAPHPGPLPPPALDPGIAGRGAAAPRGFRAWIQPFQGFAPDFPGERSPRRRQAGPLPDRALDPGIAGRRNPRARIQPFQGFARDSPGARCLRRRRGVPVQQGARGRRNPCRQSLTAHTSPDTRAPRHKSRLPPRALRNAAPRERGPQWRQTHDSGRARARF